MNRHDTSKWDLAGRDWNGETDFVFLISFRSVLSAILLLLSLFFFLLLSLTWAGVSGLTLFVILLKSFGPLSFYLPVLFFSAARALVRETWYVRLVIYSIGLFPLLTLNLLIQVLNQTSSVLCNWLLSWLTPVQSVWGLAAVLAFQLLLLANKRFRERLYSWFQIWDGESGGLYGTDDSSEEDGDFLRVQDQLGSVHSLSPSFGSEERLSPEDVDLSRDKDSFFPEPPSLPFDSGGFDGEPSSFPYGGLGERGDFTPPVEAVEDPELDDFDSGLEDLSGEPEFPGGVAEDFRELDSDTLETALEEAEKIRPPFFMDQSGSEEEGKNIPESVPDQDGREDSEEYGEELPESGQSESAAWESGLITGKSAEEALQESFAADSEAWEDPPPEELLDSYEDSSPGWEGDSGDWELEAEPENMILEEKPEEMPEDLPPPELLLGDSGLEFEEEFRDEEALEPADPLRDEEDTVSPEEETKVPPPRFQQSWKGYQVKVADLLNCDPSRELENGQIDEETRQSGEALLRTLKEFNIDAAMTHILRGPAITEFGILPAPGIKLNRIEQLADNLALRLAARSIRIVAPIPGEKAVGIEIPNRRRYSVSFAILMDSEPMRRAKNKMVLPILLGKEINGKIHIADLRYMPHLLIAGATGSGKSVCINTLISSLLLNKAPDQMRVLLIDPKIVELKQFNDIPHLLTPVVTDPKRALRALVWLTGEMERRYALLDAMGAGNKGIESYNQYIRQNSLATNPLEYIVVVIDEFADLMALVGKELETMIARLAAMSRAVGIHLVLATQRPSVDVVTGLIKANFPTRIAFMVASQTDSRTIIDSKGAENLLGQGDMLFSLPGHPLLRIQGVYISEQEVEKIGEYIKTLGPPAYLDESIFEEEEENTHALENGTDELFARAMEIALNKGEISTSFLQRKLSIGYNRAAKIIDEMEERGIIGPAQGSKKREVLYN